MKNLTMPQGWSLVAWSTLALVIMLGAITIMHGTDQSSWRIAIRATARTSVLLFLVTFVATVVRKLWPGKLTNWLRQNRRYLGVSFAVSHSCHALTILGLAIATPNSIHADHGGLLGYTFIGLMTITSFDRPAQLLGYRPWKILHGTGSYYLWLAFTLTFSKRIAENPGFYAPITVALVLALLLKLGAYWHQPPSIDKL
jgi:methionine sulfoxide reductase heme-binding subunit